MIQHMRFSRPSRLLLSFSIPSLLASMTTTSAQAQSSQFSLRPYKPRHSSFPYDDADFRRSDESSDNLFYNDSRFVTHIDDNAIRLLGEYYAQALPHSGRILDLCSSWISHFPQELEQAAAQGGKGTSKSLEVIGLGMNNAELNKNPILHQRILQDLNSNPAIPESIAPLDATTCVVSIDYLIKPVPVLSSVLNLTRPGGKVHLIISNRCFPTKVVKRWLRVSEEERLQMVGDYLWFSGWRDIEILTLSDGKQQPDEQQGIMAWFSGGHDPLWVVRGTRLE